MSFLRYLHDEKYLLANPGEGVPRPKLPDALPSEIPTEEEVLVLLQVPDTQDILGLRDRAVLELLYSCALRNAELRQLSIEDLDLHRLEVRILKGKGQKGRVLPVGEPAALWIERFLQKSRPHLVADPYEESLFVNSRGLPLSGEVLSKLVSAYAKKAKLSMKVTPHVLRHACATHMLARRAGIRYLQKFLGHAAATTTERYTRVEISDLREVYLRCHPRENP
jgi:integrase/recombinase XerD